MNAPRRRFLAMLSACVMAPIGLQQAVARPSGLEPGFGERLGKIVRGMVREELARKSRSDGFLRQRNGQERKG